MTAANRRSGRNMQRRNSLETVRYASGHHPALWFERFAPSTGGARFTDEERETFVHEMCGLGAPAGYDELFESWKAALAEAGATSREYRTSRSSSLAANLGSASLLENGIALHPLYGVPYLSGRALKGLASRFARQHLGDAWKRDSESLTTLFGTMTAAGHVEFLDSLAIPQQGSWFRREVMTPHHSAYYTAGRTAPSDRDSPVPIRFLTVKARFLVSVVGPQEWREAAFKILTNAFREEGAGGKTKFAGYGRLEPVVDHLNEPPATWQNVRLTYTRAGGNMVRCTHEGVTASERIGKIQFTDPALLETLKQLGSVDGVTVTVIRDGSKNRIITVGR